MSIKYTIANICEKFTELPHKNIKYYPSRNCFDLCAAYLDDILVTDIPSYIQYNFSLHNSILNLSAQRIYQSTGCFIHNSKPNNLKKEDLHLINIRTKNVHKIFFGEYTYNSWGRPPNSHLIHYGVPNFFKNMGNKRTKKVGLFALGSDNDAAIFDVIEKLLIENKIDYIKIVNTDNIVEQLNSCEFAIELYEHNLYNALCAKACGCSCLMPASPYLKSYESDILLFEDITEMINICKHMNTTSQVDICAKYKFDIFQKELSDIFNIINDEVFCI